MNKRERERLAKKLRKELTTDQLLSFGSMLFNDFPQILDSDDHIYIYTGIKVLSNGSTEKVEDEEVKVATGPFFCEASGQDSS